MLHQQLQPQQTTAQQAAPSPAALEAKVVGPVQLVLDGGIHAAVVHRRTVRACAPPMCVECACVGLRSVCGVSSGASLVCPPLQMRRVAAGGPGNGSLGSSLRRAARLTGIVEHQANYDGGLQLQPGRRMLERVGMSKGAQSEQAQQAAGKTGLLCIRQPPHTRLGLGQRGGKGGIHSCLLLWREVARSGCRGSGLRHRQRRQQGQCRQPRGQPQQMTSAGCCCSLLRR